MYQPESTFPAESMLSATEADAVERAALAAARGVAPDDVADEIATPESGPVRVIEPRPGWRWIDFAELWRYRELLYFLTWRDIKVRYKQTVLGAAWAVLQPVLTMLIFTIFFGRLGGMERHTTVAYPIFVYAALLPWQFFSTSMLQCGQSLILSNNLITKVYFPRLIVPVSSIGVALVDFFVSMLVMGVLMVYYRIGPSERVLGLGLCLIGTLLATVGIGTFLSALAVAYRDFRYVIPFLVQIWMFASPVAYPFDVVPGEWQLLYAVNPMAGIISGYRSALLNEPYLWGPLAVSLATAGLSFLIGTFYFRTVERRFADIV